MRIVPSLAVLLAAAGLLPAQEGSGWVVVQGGSVASTSGQILKAGTIAGIGAGGWFNDYLGAEVSLLQVQVKLKGTELKGQETHGAASLLLNFNPGGTRLLPFARMGLGAIGYQGEAKTVAGDRRASAHAGLGLQVGLGTHLLIRAEFRETRIGRKQPGHNEAAWLVGVGSRWGGRGSVDRGAPAAAGPAPAPRPMVEALPPGPQTPAVEAVPQAPSSHAVEVLPAVQNPPPPVVLVP